MSVVNTHCPDLPAAPGVAASLMVALVADSRGMVAAYQGLVPPRGRWADAGGSWASWVAERGAKLTYRQALEHFPMIPPEKYRS